MHALRQSTPVDTTATQVVPTAAPPHSRMRHHPHLTKNKARSTGRVRATTHPLATERERARQPRAPSDATCGGFRAGGWASWEDEIIGTAINRASSCGLINWESIAHACRNLGLRRRGRSIRGRWLTHLSPCVNKRPLTTHENARMLQLHAAIGPRWAAISSEIGNGRTADFIKKACCGTGSTPVCDGHNAVEPLTAPTSPTSHGDFADLIDLDECDIADFDVEEWLQDVCMPDTDLLCDERFHAPDSPFAPRTQQPPRYSFEFPSAFQPRGPSQPRLSWHAACYGAKRTHPPPHCTPAVTIDIEQHGTERCAIRPSLRTPTRSPSPPGVTFAYTFDRVFAPVTEVSRCFGCIDQEAPALAPKRVKFTHRSGLLVPCSLHAVLA